MRTTRVFNSGNSQAVRLPRQFRIDAATGDIVLSTRTVEGEGGWAEFLRCAIKHACRRIS